MEEILSNTYPGDGSSRFPWNVGTYSSAVWWDSHVQSDRCINLTTFLPHSCIFITVIFTDCNSHPQVSRIRRTLTCHLRHRGGVDVLFYSCFNIGARKGWVVSATPRPLYPQGRASLSYCRLSGLWAESWGGGGTISPIPASEHRTVQPIVIRYTDWAIVVAPSLEWKY